MIESSELRGVKSILEKGRIALSLETRIFGLKMLIVSQTKIRSVTVSKSMLNTAFTLTPVNNLYLNQFKFQTVK